MSKAQPIRQQLWSVAQARHGVVTAAELDASGISEAAKRRRVKSRTLLPLFHGVFAIAPLADHFTFLAAIQLLYPNLIAERRTAAAVWDLDGFEFTVLDLVRPPGARYRRRGLPKTRVARIPQTAIVVEHGIRVTAPAWTLAAVERAGACADEVELALECALRRQLTTEAALRDLATAPVLQEALSRRRAGSPPTDSYAETRFLQTIVRPLDLEDPQRQVPIQVPGRPIPYRCDFLFRRHQALDVEIDGDEGHIGADAHDHDTLRDHHLRVYGCQVVRFPARRMLRSPSGTRTALLHELDAISGSVI